MLREVAFFKISRANSMEGLEGKDQDVGFDLVLYREWEYSTEH